jgi:hypothetical protein
MSNFIEELLNGDCFESNNTKYVITSDFKGNGRRLSINLSDGNTRWFNSNDIVTKISLFYTNLDGHVVALKETSKNDMA